MSEYLGRSGAPFHARGFRFDIQDSRARVIQNVDEREIEAANAALVEVEGMDPKDAAKHIVLTLRPTMWLRLQRKVDVLEAQLARSLHPSSQ